MGWLAGYTKRIKLTTDNTKVDSTLSNFPVTVFFTSSQAEEIFTEFDADANYMKCAFTQSDGTTQLYAEKESFLYASQYPTAHSDTYVKSTTKAGTSYWAYYATDPTKSLTGGGDGKSWLSVSGTVTNQRFHIDLGSAKVIKRIYYENMHASGIETNRGVQNFTFWGSNTGAGSFDDLVYANDEGWTQLTTSQSTFDEHAASDAADPKYITVTNATAYRYYAFKFADTHGDGTFMGVRRIELQTWEAIYHVKVTSISSSADTDIYYYYNNSIADNTTYIGAIGVRTEVWDANHKIVYHMADLTTSTVEDSTNNSNDGTKASANNPIEAVGKVSKGQTYDAGSDRIYSGAALAAMSNFTLEVLVKFSSAAGGSSDTLFCIAGNGNYNDPSIFRYTDETLNVYADGAEKIVSTGTIADTNWHHVVIVADGTYIRLYIDGTEDASSPVSYTGDSVNEVFNVGDNSVGSDTFDGTIDEARVSNTGRTAAWIKATYNTLYDTLLTYGTEELEATFNYFGYNST